MPDNLVTVRRALISVSDKTGLDALGRSLHAAGVEIISTGGTRKYLEDRQIPVTPIEKVTGNPEAFGGRMKTISFEMMSAILFRRGADDAEAEKLGIAPVDLVVCNLYPFEKTAQETEDEALLIENIDIGGVTLIRSAAKNHAAVCVMTDPAQYGALAQNDEGGIVTALSERKNFALSAFRHTARYDAAIAGRFEMLQRKAGNDDILHTPLLTAETAEVLRYGENPQQKAWVYKDPFAPQGLAHSVPLQGKPLSYNNLLDADAAWRAAQDLALVSDGGDVAVIVKHLNPCGAACSKISARDALENAWRGDPVSAFGGIICLTSPCTADVAAFLSDKFIEIILAPAFDDAALAVFAKKKNLRVMISPPAEKAAPFMLRAISGGVLVQQEDFGADEKFEIVTREKFDAAKKNAAQFGIMAAKHLRSNAIALVQENAEGGVSLTGAGPGNPNRLVSTVQAIEKARENGYDDLSRAVLVSDAFFPFPDNVELAAEHGLRFIVQPGGSVRDDAVIAACDAAGIAMAFTGRRHFRH